MNIRLIPFASTTALVLLASHASAQNVVVMPELVPADARGAFKLKLMAEGMSNKVISGAPYSAQQTTRTTQMLADGNRIVNSSTAKVYRDQQGRTRVEHSIGSSEGTAAQQPGTTVMIDDPVAGAHYVLEPDGHTARKLTISNPRGSSGDAMYVVNPSEDMAVPAMRAGPLGARLEYRAVINGAPANAAQTEDLGTQNMEGVLVKGTRTTLTIPSGSIGNDLPINIVSERWYSPELQMNIMTSRSDPRMGQTVYTVTGISRANPEPSLFQVPAGFQISEAKGARTVTFQKAPGEPQK